MSVRALALWVSRLAVFALALAFTLPRPAWAQVFQWSDARGVIHFTDNASAIPESVKGSPQLIIRGDFDMRARSSEISTPPEIVRPEPASQPKAPEVVSPPEPEPTKVAPPIIYYNPQYFTIVVVNSIVRQPRRICPIPEGCRPVFQPNFDDRRYIHPSAFNGGSRQFIQPELFPPARR